jgi:hypothetical protein
MLRPICATFYFWTAIITIRDQTQPAKRRNLGGFCTSGISEAYKSTFSTGLAAFVHARLRQNHLPDLQQREISR